MADGDEAREIEEMFSQAAWDGTCRRVVKEMCDHVAPVGTPISISMGGGRVGKQSGTGSYLDLFGVKLLLSCQHVLGKLSNEPLAHKLAGQERFVAVNEAFYGEASLPLDAAVVAVPPLAWDEYAGSSKALSLDRIALFHAPCQHELLFVRGFAAENSRFVYDTLTTDATSYLAREASVPTHRDVSDRFHFALEYRRDAAVIAFGGRLLPDPRAMSGSLVWNTRFVEMSRQRKPWSPSDAVVTGLLWFWLDEDRIVATRIEYVRSFLLAAMQKRSEALPPAAGECGDAKPSGG